MNSLLSILIALYARLLLLYPASWRDKFEADMSLDFSDLAFDAERQGKLSLIRFCAQELIDFPVNLVYVYLKEGDMSRILHSHPVNSGLRGSIAFGVAMAFTVPISLFVYEKLFIGIDSIDAYDFGLISWIPAALSNLIIGLVLGVLLALLFADRSNYVRYVFAGLLGWCLYHAVSEVLTFLRFWVFLDNNQLMYFDYMVLAFSGAILGLVFVIANSRRREAISWLAVGVFVYPLFAYLWVERLFALLAFRTPWRFVGLMTLMTILVISVFAFAMKFENLRKIPLILIAGTIGFPATRFIMLGVFRLIYPPMITPEATFGSITILISNLIYGVLFGLFLGLVFGLQHNSVSKQIEP